MQALRALIERPLTHNHHAWWVKVLVHEMVTESNHLSTDWKVANQYKPPAEYTRRAIRCAM